MGGRVSVYAYKYIPISSWFTKRLESQIHIINYICIHHIYIYISYIHIVLISSNIHIQLENPIIIIPSRQPSFSNRLSLHPSPNRFGITRKLLHSGDHRHEAWTALGGSSQFCMVLKGGVLTVTWWVIRFLLKQNLKLKTLLLLERSGKKTTQ